MSRADEIYSWTWAGDSIEDIKAFATKHGMSVQDLVEDFFPSGWPETVPSEYQDSISGEISHNKSHGENSLAKVKQVMSILAIDRSDKALVKTGTIDLYLDAEGYSIKEVTKAEAIALAESYRNEFKISSASPDDGLGLKVSAEVKKALLNQHALAAEGTSPLTSWLRIAQEAKECGYFATIKFADDNTPCVEGMPGVVAYEIGFVDRKDLKQANTLTIMDKAGKLGSQRAGEDAVYFLREPEEITNGPLSVIRALLAKDWSVQSRERYIEGSNAQQENKVSRSQSLFESDGYRDGFAGVAAPEGRESVHDDEYARGYEAGVEEREQCNLIATTVMQLLDGEPITQFKSFDEFSNWLDTVNTYEEWDQEPSEADHQRSQELLALVYQELIKATHESPAKKTSGMRLG